MKVIIPVEDNSGAKDKVAEGFHNAKYACIYDCESKTFEWLATSDIAAKAGNLSIELKRKGIQTVISDSMPLMALGLFIESGFKVYKAGSNSVDENIELFLANKLASFSAAFASVDSGCSSSCSTCSSSCN